MPAAFAQINSVLISKTQVYVQSSATDVSLRPANVPCNFQCPFTFSAQAGGTNVASVTPPVLSGPIATANLGTFWNGGQLGYAPGSNLWWLGIHESFEWTAPTQAALDATFANGTYAMSVNGASVPMRIAGDLYPNPPRITLSGGTWSGGKYVVDAGNRVTMSSDAFTGYGAHFFDTIFMYGCTSTGCSYSGRAAPGTNSLAVTFPANSFVNGNEYSFAFVFEAFVDQGPQPPGYIGAASYRARTTFTLKAQAAPPVFPMTVTSSITPTIANASATFEPRPQDVGKTASVYVFALAPATQVKNAASEKGAFLGHLAKGGEKDGVAVQCVLAQLTASGDLKAVSTSSLQAYATNVLSGQGQAVTILNNVPTVNIAGATFYVGYGSDPLAMITTGVNRRALSLPASLACDPAPPETGWWWNTKEGGRGYSVEVAGNHLFFASYLYDASGRATWLIASGNTSLDGSLFTGNLESYAQGQTLGGAYKPARGTVGDPVTLTFNDATHGTLVWPGGAIPIERFDIVPGGARMAARANQPESGWWWNPQEPGRGFFLEWQGGQLFMAGYMYDDAGNPIWYFSGDAVPATNLLSYSNVWQQLGGGPTLTGTYRAPTQVSGNVGSVAMQFRSARSGTMTLPGGRTIDIERYSF